MKRKTAAEIERDAVRRHREESLAEKKWRFRATITRDVSVGGMPRYKAGEVLRPKGFYYSGHRDKHVVLVGSLFGGHCARVKLPRDAVELDASFREAESREELME